MASAAVFIYAVQDSTGFFQILVYALLVQLIAMGCVGLAAMLVPKTRPELYRASTSQRTIAGIPAVQIAGLGAILTGLFVWFCYLHYDQLGTNSNLGKLAFWTIGPGRARPRRLLRGGGVKKGQGTDVNLVYREIPPE